MSGTFPRVSAVISELPSRCAREACPVYLWFSFCNLCLPYVKFSFSGMYSKWL